MNLDVEIHGGITFAQRDILPDGSAGPDSWIGFDAAHSGDAPDPRLLQPGAYPRWYPLVEFVRSQEYMEAQCKFLCEQAAAAYPIVEIPIAETPTDPSWQSNWWETSK